MKKIVKLFVMGGLIIGSHMADAQAPPTANYNNEATAFVSRLDSLMNAFHGKHYTYSDELNTGFSFDTNDVPTYSNDVMQYRLSLLESPIPLEYNQHVKNYIDLYTLKKRKLTTFIATWSKYYFPMFEQILDQQGLPLEFKYLAVIESALNPNAVSWCGATGLWQFMYGTGLMYGLKINNFVDERKDPLKATYAACQYFKDMYATYGDWLLVIAAYNCGPGNVSRAIRRSGGKKTFWEIMPYLPVETRGYVPAFIAAAYTLNYYKEHNIPTVSQVVNYVTDTVHVDSKLTFAQLSQSLNISEEDLKMLNPSYKLNIIPHPVNDKNHVLRLPHSKALAFTDLRQNIYTSVLQNYLKPLPAQTVFKDESSISSFKKNNISSSYQKKSTSMKYFVKRGEGLYAIAGKFGCSMDDIKRWNGMHNNYLYPGQSLTVFVNRM